MNLSKRVIILNKLNSSTIDQAIFILKEEQCDEFSAVFEAEKIVDEYITGTLYAKHRHITPILIGATLFFSALAVIFALF